ncbi:methionine synthase II (cobalamin-independent) [Actinobacillus equuli]|nr:methionine synthase II (cobalamin-independent) [Actinobacillus equuli]
MLEFSEIYILMITRKHNVSIIPYGNATYFCTLPFDIVGSFLRTDPIKQARQQCSCGDISCADLTQVEDAEIAKLVEHQKAVGLHAVTDGEFRRTFWHMDFLAALDGIQEVDAEKFSVQFKHHSVRPKQLRLLIKWIFRNRTRL